jgi:hypothetical protein
MPNGDRTRSILYDTDVWSDVRDRFLPSWALRGKFAALPEVPGRSAKSRAAVRRVMRAIGGIRQAKNYGELDVYRKMRIDGSNYPYAIVASGGSRHSPGLHREADQVWKMLRDRGVAADIVHSSREFFDAMNQNARKVVF